MWVSRQTRCAKAVSFTSLPPASAAHSLHMKGNTFSTALKKKNKSFRMHVIPHPQIKPEKNAPDPLFCSSGGLLRPGVQQFLRWKRCLQSNNTSYPLHHSLKAGVIRVGGEALVQWDATQSQKDTDTSQWRGFIEIDCVPQAVMTG